jgi:hypothetical protein
MAFIDETGLDVTTKTDYAGKMGYSMYCPRPPRVICAQHAPGIVTVSLGADA